MARERNPHPPPIFRLAKVKHILYGGYRQEVKTWDCGSRIRWFESHYPPSDLIMGYGRAERLAVTHGY